MQFKGFKPEALQKIAGSMGYQGDMGNFNQYLQGNPAAMQRMNNQLCRWHVADTLKNMKKVVCL